MRAPRSTSSTTHRVSRFIRRSLAGLVAVTAACGGDSPLAPESDAPEPAATYAKGSGGPATCVKDSRFLGLIEVSAADEPGTWWHLTRTGFDAAGITDYKAKIESTFGMRFNTQQDAIDYLIAQVVAFDNIGNGNGWVCVYTYEHGTRANLGLPDYAFYTWWVRDDKHTGS